jgi:GNAT superfamily N-acetyltransferase
MGLNTFPLLVAQPEQISAHQSSPNTNQYRIVSPERLMSFDPNLYVHPDYQGRGVGTALLARCGQPRTGLRLWTFQQNEGAVLFYERNGFHNLRTSGGLKNEERLPACLMSWPTPVAHP